MIIEPFYTPTALSTPPYHAYFPRYIAHKAIVSRKQLGNTLSAIEEALDSAEVDGLEVDLRYSKDGKPFICHGDTLEESTNGKGRPEDKTWEELQTFTYLLHAAIGRIWSIGGYWGNRVRNGPQFVFDLPQKVFSSL